MKMYILVQTIHVFLSSVKNIFLLIYIFLSNLCNILDCMYSQLQLCYSFINQKNTNYIVLGDASGMQLTPRSSISPGI